MLPQEAWGFSLLLRQNAHPLSHWKSKVGSLWGTDTARDSGLDQNHLFFNTCWKFQKISSLFAVRETIHIGEGEHQGSCFRTREVEGSILPALCCAWFDIYTSITRAGVPAHAQQPGQPGVTGPVLSSARSGHAPLLTAQLSAPQTPLKDPLGLLRLLRIQATQNFSSTASFFYWCSSWYLWFRK